VNDTTNAVPNPGSDEAITKGCTCPVIDNHHGQGAAWGRGTDSIFWYTSGCPVHWPVGTNPTPLNEEVKPE